jgi:hypothetical protein
MYKDDFKGFFNDRKERILQKIEKAMGKAIMREQSLTEEGEYVDVEEFADETVDFPQFMVFDENAQLSSDDILAMDGASSLIQSDEVNR